MFSTITTHNIHSKKRKYICSDW